MSTQNCLTVSLIIAKGTPATYGVTTVGFTMLLKNIKKHAAMENWHLIISNAIFPKTHLCFWMSPKIVCRLYFKKNWQK